MQRDESLEQQQERCRNAALEHGFQIDPTLEFSDAATSGTKRDREGLNALLKAAENGEFSTLYLYSLSRLARESVITMPLLKMVVHRYGIRVVCLSDSIDTANNGWELIASIYAVIHEQYIKDLAHFVLRGQEGAFQANFSVGDCCFGYTSEPLPGSENNRAGRNSRPRMVRVIHPEQAEIVLQVFRWFVKEQRSLGWIARKLNELGAPKDHRSSTADWHHALVRNLLRREKYIGRWPWGKMKNLRDPETGKVFQKERSENDPLNMVRELPNLRIVDDRTFELAQERLDENEDKYAPSRREGGQFNGSSSETNGRRAEPLLYGLVTCAACGSPFQSDGKRMRCRGGKRGTCEVVTSLKVPLANEKILEAIGSQIDSDDEWFELLYQALVASHREYQRQVPDAILALEREKQDVGRKIKRLLDQIEQGSTHEFLTARLEQREQELCEIDRKLASLHRKTRPETSSPNRDWLRQQLSQLKNVLGSSTPGANAILRQLIVGSIQLECVPVPLRKQYFFRGRFKISFRSVLSSVDEQSEPNVLDDSGVTLTVEFKEPDRVDGQRETAMKMHDEGHLIVEIAAVLRVSKARVTKLLDEGFALRGEAKPDGRARRSNLQEKQRELPLYQKIADDVKRLCDEDVLLADIAETLGADRNTVTKAIKFWHTSRGLPIPDGRTRRKSLVRKQSTNDALRPGGN